MTSPEEEYLIIPLTKGQVAKVNVFKYAEISANKWYAAKGTNPDTYYAVRNAKLENGKRIKVYMHRQILGLGYGDPREGDHEDPSITLDNRLSNLRIATRKENARNTRKYARKPENRIRLKGVCKVKEMFASGIYADGVKKHLGTYRTEIEAHLAYCYAAAHYHREFARTQ